MPMGATLALCKEDKGFIRGSDGTKLLYGTQRVPGSPMGISPLPAHLVWVNRHLYQDGPLLSRQVRGKSLGDRDAGVKAFLCRV
jgi:hypothetical protein